MLAPKPWRTDVLLQLACGLLVAIGATSLLSTWMMAAEGSYFPSFVVRTLGFQGTILILAHLFVRAHGISWNEAFGFRTSGQVGSVLLAIGATVLVLPVAWMLSRWSSELMTYFDVTPTPQEAVTTLQTAFETKVEIGPQIYMAFMAIAVAPAAEEILFRGILFPFFKARLHPVIAWLGIAVLFAGVHANAMTFVSLTVLALVLTLLYEVTGNLLAPILTHSLFNLANFIYLARSQPG